MLCLGTLERETMNINNPFVFTYLVFVFFVAVVCLWRALDSFANFYTFGKSKNYASAGLCNLAMILLAPFWPLIVLFFLGKFVLDIRQSYKEG